MTEMQGFWMEQLVWCIRIAGAGLIGAWIGFERKSRHKNAGVRTHAIVALGAAMLMIISKYGFYDAEKFDAARVAAQIVSGVGFLGAGLIFVRNRSINGLTTAAGIWTTAGVGMAVGAGLWIIAVFSAVLLLGLQFVFHKYPVFSHNEYTHNLRMDVLNDPEVIGQVEKWLRKHHLYLESMEIEKEDTVAHIQLVLDAEVLPFTSLAAIPGVLHLEEEE